ncbi:MAG: oxygenase MpaB family protein [Gaiellaceae bacterium]
MAEDKGYFAHDSAIRRIGVESILMLGGGRALLMQAAHPLVAAGIVQHSRYGDEPWRRLARTMTALYTIVFGSRQEANRAGEKVRAVHTGVQGRLRERVGPFRRGMPYSAADPELQLWVHATLVDTGLVMYERCVRRLEQAEREDFYDQMKVVGAIFGLPSKAQPRSLVDFEDYQRDLLAGTTLSIGNDARAVAETVLRPPVPVPLWPTARTLALLNVGLLPDPLRERYGLRFGLPERALLAASDRTARSLVVPLLPGPVRGLAPRRRSIPFALLAAFAR